MKNRFDSVGQTFGDNLNTLQSGRVKALEDATDLQIMARSLTEHETLRIEKKLGEQHPRTLQLKSRIITMMAAIESLQVEHEIAQIKVPDVAEQDALVQGRVKDENARGFADLTVCLIDKDGTPSDGLNPSTTDLSGYFAIILDKDLASAIAENQCPPLFLGIFTPRNRLVYKSKGPLAINPSARITEDAILDRRTLSDLSGPKKPQPIPEPNSVAVPDLISLTETDALEKTKSAGLKLGDRKEQIVVDQVDRVLEQAPVAGTKVKPKSPVHIVVGVARRVEVPNLIGKRLQQGMQILQRFNLVAGKITDRSDDRHNIVLDQKPLANTEVKIEAAVNLVVGKKKSIPKEDIIDRIEKDDAFSEIGASGQKLRKWFDVHGIDSMEKVAELRKKPDREFRDDFRLKNLKSVEVFKGILDRLLGKK